MARTEHRELLLTTLRHSPYTVSYAELIRIAGRGTAERAIARGEVVRILPGRYSAVEHSESFPARAHAALHWVGTSAALTGAGAMYWRNAIARPPDTVLLTVRHGVSRQTPPWLSIVSTTYDVPSFTIRGIEVARSDYALAQGFGRLPRRDRAAFAFATLAHLARFGSETDHVAATIKSLPVVKARRQLMAVIASHAGGAESWLEDHAGRKVLSTAEFSHLWRQHTLMIEGQTLRFDFYCADTRTAIEFDGAAFHGNLDQRERDIARDALAATVGIQTVRFGYQDTVHRPDVVRVRALGVLRARRTRPAA